MSHAINTAINEAWKNTKKVYAGDADRIAFYLNGTRKMCQAVLDDPTQPVGVKCSFRCVLHEICGIDVTNVETYYEHVMWAAQTIKNELWHIRGLNDSVRTYVTFFMVNGLMKLMKKFA